MTLPASGQLSFSEIQTEHEGIEPISLSEYYEADDGVPSSGELSLSDFFGTGYAPVFTVNEGSGTNGPDTYYGYLTGDLNFGSIDGSPSQFRGIDITTIGFGDTVSLGDIAIFELAGNQDQDVFTSIVFEDLSEKFSASAASYHYDSTYDVTTWIWDGISIPAVWDGSGQATVRVHE